MIVFVNSREQEIAEGASVGALLLFLNISEKRVAVEVNQELVTRNEWPLYKLKAGDRVEIVSFVGGG